MKICLGKYLRAVHILSIIPALAKYSFVPFVKPSLQKKAESLSKTAKEAILNPKEKESVNQQF